MCHRVLALIGPLFVVAAVACAPLVTPEIVVPTGVEIQRDPQQLARLTLSQIASNEVALGVRLADPRIVRIAYYRPGEPIPRMRWDGTVRSEPCGVVSDTGPDPGCWLVEAEGTFVLTDRSRGRRGWFVYVDDPADVTGGFGFVACWGRGADPAKEEPCPEAAPTLNYDRARPPP